MNPRSYGTFTRGRLLLKSIGFWPSEALGEPNSQVQNILYWSFTTYYLIILICMVHYISIHVNQDFYQVCHLLACFGIASFTLPYLLIPIAHKKPYGVMFKMFFDEIHVMNFKEHDDVTTPIWHQIEGTTKNILKVLSAVLVFGPFAFFYVPVYLNIKTEAFGGLNGTKLESAVYFSSPYNCESNVKHWIICTAITSPLIFLSPIIQLTMNVVFALFMIHIVGNVMMIKQQIKQIAMKKQITITLDTFQVKVDEVFTEEENDEITAKIIKIIGHHLKLLRFLKLMQQCFGELLLAMYCFDMIGYCLILFQLSEKFNDGLFRYGPIAICTFAQMTYFSLSVDDLSAKLSNLSDDIYNTPWISMSKDNCKALSFITLVLQKKAKITAANFMEVSGPVMLKIIKTTFSLFTLLKQLKNA